MIHNEQQYMVTMQQWAKFNEAILGLKRTPLSDVPRLVGVNENMPGGDVSSLLLAECELLSLTSMRDELKAEMDEYDRRVHAHRKGRWMPLYSGIRFWPEDPHAADIDIRDIAHSLAAINRFNGHTKVPYSVAQHCVVGSYVINPLLALPFLLHDAGECYLGDVITPIKRLFRDFYEPVEEKVMRAVAAKFHYPLTDRINAAVKRVDIIMLATEVRDLTTTGVVTQPLTELPLDHQIAHCWDAAMAERVFLERFEELMSARNTKRRQAV